eukprot:TRINITY_DN5263_c0_g1_i1.p1 TRINITY_DN5263_c0_g1~~TRINITY_DN5263_c0_g1_i1.p1  ORF type:complete len:173 (-),score=11.79 TRINITY_DN5263_c0_g1_i1:45-563(-)
MAVLLRGKYQLSEALETHLIPSKLRQRKDKSKRSLPTKFLGTTKYDSGLDIVVLHSEFSYYHFSVGNGFAFINGKPANIKAICASSVSSFLGAPLALVAADLFSNGFTLAEVEHPSESDLYISLVFTRPSGSSTKVFKKIPTDPTTLGVTVFSSVKPSKPDHEKHHRETEHI